MKGYIDKLSFYLSTLFLLLYIYLYFFEKERYTSILQSLFYRDSKRMEEDDLRDQSAQRAKVDGKLLFYGFLTYYISYFIISLYCKSNIYSIAKEYYKSIKERRLYDLGHVLIPYSKYSKYISEGITFFIIGSFFLFFIYQPNIQLLYGLLFIYAILILLRSCIYNLTLLPDASEECTYSNYFASCNDLLFSGHSSKILILLLLADHYNLVSDSISKLYYLLYILMLLFILSSRHHYTIDLLFGIIIALLVYYLYYQKVIFGVVKETKDT